MKKIIILIPIIILLTGCSLSQNEFKCTFSDNSAEDEIRLMYDEDRNITFIKQTTITKVDPDYYEYSIEYMNEAASSLNEITGVNASVSKMSGNKVKMYVEFDYTKMDVNTLYTLFSGEEYKKDANEEEIEEYIKVQTNVDEAVTNMLSKYKCVDLK